MASTRIEDKEVSATMFPLPEATQVGGWQVKAIEEYEHSIPGRARRVRQERQNPSQTVSRKEQHEMKTNSTGMTLARRISLLLVATAMVLVLASGVAFANFVPCGVGTPPRCGGETPDQQASQGDDVISGSALDDNMSGFGGNDEGYGHGGNDNMMGMEGNDTFDGGTGNDVFGGGPDDDYFLGAEGDDSTYLDILGGYVNVGDDTLDGGAGNDRLDGGEDDDKLYGGEGVDRLRGYTGGDFMDGGAGDDEITDGSGDVNDTTSNGIVGGDGDDTINVGGYGHFTIHGDDTLLGVTGNDVVYGGFLNDEIKGGPGNDDLSGRSGGDDLLGGKGNDILGKGHDLDDDEDPGRDSFYGGEGNDFILAKDGENDRFIDCGEGVEDVAEVDHGLGEWRDVVACEIIWDGVGPSISSWGPTQSTKDRTPIIQANARDSHPRARIKKADVKMYVDGRRVSASYNPLRGLLTYTPTMRLALGSHTVKVEAVEEEGLKATKTWSFKVIK